MDDVTVVIDPDGTVRLIYDDDVREAMRELEEAGDCKVSRAAHVEPVNNSWAILSADYSQELHPGTFERREDALLVEREIVNAALAN